MLYGTEQYSLTGTPNISGLCWTTSATGTSSPTHPPTYRNSRRWNRRFKKVHRISGLFWYPAISDINRIILMLKKIIIMLWACYLFALNISVIPIFKKYDTLVIFFYFYESFHYFCWFLLPGSGKPKWSWSTLLPAVYPVIEVIASHGNIISFKLSHSVGNECSVRTDKLIINENLNV